MNNSTDNVPVRLIPSMKDGACFHGEVWGVCPHCGEAHQIVGKPFEYVEDGWSVYRCKCGKLFKDR